MAKGLFTQSLCLLLSHQPLTAEVEQCLPGLQRQSQGAHPWPSVADSWWLPAPQLGNNGRLILDLIPVPWPDDCGDADQPDLYGAWCLGYLGPLTFPGGLARASRRTGLSGQHAGVLHLKSSYAMGADDEAPLLPMDYQAPAELDLMHRTLGQLAALPHSLAYFNPGGEVLHSHPGWLEMSGLPLCIGLQSFRTDRSLIVTTVGMEQFDLLDQQAEVFSESIEVEQLGTFVMDRAVAHLAPGQGSRDGAVVDALGHRWQAKLDESVGPRPRNALCWTPQKVKRRGWFGIPK
ncbi:hypothetical protein IV102_22040 [bacterium]|nr:hypothetical protein [bacterium]